MNSLQKYAAKRLLIEKLAEKAVPLMEDGDVYFSHPKGRSKKKPKGWGQTLRFRNHRMGTNSPKTNYGVSGYPSFPDDYKHHPYRSVKRIPAPLKDAGNYEVASMKINAPTHGTGNKSQHRKLPAYARQRPNAWFNDTPKK